MANPHAGKVLYIGAKSWHDSHQGYFLLLKLEPAGLMMLQYSSHVNTILLFFNIYFSTFFFFKKAVRKIYIVRNREVNNTSTYGSF